MEFNISFFTGLGCGVCLGLTFYALRKYLVFPKSTKSITKYASRLEPKVVLVVRTDLNMSKGKIAAQCGHAAVGVFEKAMKQDPETLRRWQSTGQAKVALKVDNEDDLFEIQKEAKRKGLITSVIRDAGRTQIAPNTITVLGVGPAPQDIVDQVTGHLKLL